MRRDAKRHDLRIKRFSKPIAIPRTGEDDSPDRFVHCTVCDAFAYCTVSEDGGTLIKVNYYCKKCVGKFLVAQ